MTLAWDPNPEPNIAGYLISYGTSSGSYSTRVNVGNVTTWSASLTPGFRYYFAAQAYVTSGQQSALSAEVFTDVGLPTAPSITSLSPTSGSVGTAVTINGANFGATQGTSSVRFNGTEATPTSWSATRIVVPVPTGAATGPVVVTVNGAASNGVTFTVPTSGLPAPWVSRDIGNPAVAGRASYASGMFSVSGAGADIWGVMDQFHYVYQPLDGNGAMVAGVAGVQLQDPWTKAAVMIREELTGDAPHAMVAVTPSNGTIFQSRATRGGQSTSTTGAATGAPRWLAVTRSGNSLSGYYSTNGTTWTLMGTRTIPMSARVYVGMAVTSHRASVTATSVFAYATVVKNAAASQTSSVVTAPASQFTGGNSAGSQPETARTADAALPVPRTPGDYDGDGKADMAVFRPSAGTWHILKSSGGLATSLAVGWGTTTDVPVPGDYDGDGRTDVAFYRPTSGLWSILESSTNYTAHADVFIGEEGAVPVPGDYDGDGKTDVAVYSPATGRWRILESRAGFVTETTLTWGSGSDVAVPGDYDGDGKADPAVYQRATGQWRILPSSTDHATNVTLALGTATDIAVPGDYDGDGVSDAAIFQPATATWIAKLSGRAFETTTLATLGASGDVPVPGDYDGDGRTDIAVVRNGTWQVLYSTLSYSSGLSIAWGERGDVSLPGRP